MGDMEESPIRGGILATEMGGGKLRHLKLAKDPNAVHKLTIIIVPSTLIESWIICYQIVFQQIAQTLSLVWHTCQCYSGDAIHADQPVTRGIQWLRG